MVSTQTRFLVIVGVLIAVVSAGLTAFLVNASKPAGVAAVKAPPPQVLALAASTTSNTITVVGYGTASGVPDQADLNLGVTATRSTVRDAVTAAGNDMNKLLGAMRSVGVQDKNIQTTSLSVYQQTTCCPQNVTGYTAASQITIAVPRVASATGIIESAVDAVGNDLQINGVMLSLSDPNPMVKSARDAAMKDADARAQDWARLSGHHVGGLISVSEVIPAAPSYTCAGGCGKGAAGGGGGVAIMPGQTMVTITVAATYELVT